MLSIWDLHCHTTASDGVLSPSQLYLRAAGCGVAHLAITDHDSVEGIRELRAELSTPPALPSTVAALHTPPALVNGVEITARAESQVVHVVGLWIDIDSQPLESLLSEQQELRRLRGREISDRLEAKGLPPTYDGAMLQADGSALGRPHFARYMQEIGVVNELGHAFKHWLGAGKPGDVGIEWPTLARVVEVIQAAGGKAVLAHPHKYKLGYGKIYTLCEQFKALGGDAIEVVSGAQRIKETKDLARISDRLDLAASTGSDFHSPKQVWCDLGRQPLLPEACVPIWELNEALNVAVD